VLVRLALPRINYYEWSYGFSIVCAGDDVRSFFSTVAASMQCRSLFFRAVIMANKKVLSEPYQWLFAGLFT